MSEDAWLKLEDQRKQRIDALIEWAKERKKELLRLAPKDTLWHAYRNEPEKRKRLLGNKLASDVRKKIVADYGLSSKTAKEYVEVVLIRAGCVHKPINPYSRRLAWFCPF